VGELRELAERDAAGEETRRGQDQRDRVAEAKIDGFERVEVKLFDEPRVEVADDAPEACAQRATFRGFALDQRGAFAVFTQAHETVAEVGLYLLLLVGEPDQRPSDL